MTLRDTTTEACPGATRMTLRDSTTETRTVQVQRVQKGDKYSEQRRKERGSAETGGKKTRGVDT